MKSQSLGFQPDFLTVKMRAYSADIPIGSPVCYMLTGDDADGAVACLPSEVQTLYGAVDSNVWRKTFVGVAKNPISISSPGDVQVYGFVQTIKLVRSTRAATTDAFPDADVVARHACLKVITSCNAFQATNDAGNQHDVILAQDLAFVGSSAMPATATAYTVTARALISFRVL